MSDAIRSNYLAESKKDDLADSFNQAHVEDEDKVVEKTERKKRKRKARSVPAKKNKTCKKNDEFCSLRVRVLNTGRSECSV